MKVKAKKINNPDCDYLTEGKVYEAFEIKGTSDYAAHWVFDNGEFCITDDLGCIFYGLFKGCSVIKGDWTIITEPARVR